MAFAFGAAWMIPSESGALWPTLANLGLALFTAAAYSVAFASIVREYVRDPDVPGLRWMVPALAVATLPAWARVAGTGARAARDADLLAGCGPARRAPSPRSRRGCAARAAPA